MIHSEPPMISATMSTPNASRQHAAGVVGRGASDQAGESTCITRLASIGLVLAP